MSAFPPQRSHVSVPVSTSVALEQIQNYLQATKEYQYLLPNARLEPTGPAASSGQSSITIRNLERVEAGKDEGVRVVTGMDDGVDQGRGDEVDVDGWQDLEEYQREQSIEVGDIAPRKNAVAQGGEELQNEIETQTQAPKKGNKHAESSEMPTSKQHKAADGNKSTNGDGSMAKKDKEERKAEKRKRGKEYRRQKELQKLEVKS
ncbi:hypothetical protein B0O99DRAFT_650467 [Bisporella sp. PMI_857]|nr:hypothetical protein B0O99DRAFT_650467 [Bisporella sp. PMI_857]